MFQKLIALALRQLDQDLPLPLGEGREQTRRIGPPACEVRQNPACHRRAKDRLATGHRPNGADHLVFGGIFQDVTMRACP